MSKELTIKELTEQLYEKDTIPYWTDHCGHGGYLFSFTSYSTKKDVEAPDELIDVYCWDNRGMQEFCLRFANEAGDYYSPGGIENIIARTMNGHRPYLECYELLKLVGDIRFVVFDKEDE